MTDEEKAIFTKAVFAMNDELKRREPDWAWLARVGVGIGFLSTPIDATPPISYADR